MAEADSGSQAARPTPRDAHPTPPAPASGAGGSGAAPDHDDARHGPLAPLALGALGVVFGDIGTSPLYALQTVFSLDHNAVAATPLDVYGILSLVFWSVTLVVSIKYVVFVMRADNEGEGGILALVALLRRTMTNSPRRLAIATLLGITGAALFYGDSVITPAISVMSAIEGVEIVDPAAGAFVEPASIVVLTVLFGAQRWGTERVGRLFGPVMVCWFLVLGVLGVPAIVAHPTIVQAFLPWYALDFAVQRPVIAFMAMGAIVLTITGAEALYADMGHFGSRPIRLSWFLVVFPCLMLNYLGQGATIINDPATIDNPFFHLAPEWARLPLVILATCATVIASQAVISGAFSVSQQATRLGFLPRLHVKHTSAVEGGQIYIGSVNWILYVGVIVLVLAFGSSVHLANAYGLAVTGTLILSTALFLLLAKEVWHWSLWRLIPIAVVIGGLELVYFGANVIKIPTGGWLPLLIGSALLLVMTTWRQGSAEVEERRALLEGPLDAFVARTAAGGIQRVPGISVYPHPDRKTVPLALKENLQYNHVLHERVVIVSIVNENVPHVRHLDRARVTDLGSPGVGIVHLAYHVGFNDTQDVPQAVRWGVGLVPEMEFDPDDARYFLSVVRLQHDSPWRLREWRRRLFLALNTLAARRSGIFHLPTHRTVVIGSQMEF